MGVPRLHSRLKELRVQAGLQQRELARRIGVSRQTLSALETGTSVPATSIALQLASVLRCRVEDIFCLDDAGGALDAALVTARESTTKGGLLRRVAVATVDERWVAHLLDGEGETAFGSPADAVLAGTRAEPRARSVRVRPLRESKALRENLFAAGCDPALALLAGHVRERFDGGRLHWLEAGSGAALDMFAEREVNVAGVHLYDPETGDHNVAPVRRRVRGRPTVLVNLAIWEQGLLVASANPRKIRGIADLGRKGIRVVAREAGTGAQELLHRLAAPEGVTREAIDVVSVARGHMAVARTVAAGMADAGIATRAAAACYGLRFVPLAEARFDLVMARDPDDVRLQRLLDVLGSQRFRRDLGSLTGYGTTRTGRIVAEVS